MNNYHLQHKKPNKKFFRIITVIIVFIAIVAVIQAIFPNFFSQTMHYTARPLWKIKNSLTAISVDTIQLLKSKRGLIEENNILREKEREVFVKLLERNILKEENKLLKELFGRTIYEDAILATVLARPNVSPYDTLIIDGGKNSGIKEGNNVTVSGSIVIGEISNVYENTAIVRLFSSPNEKTIVAVGQENIFTEAMGQGGGNFIIHIPRDADVSEGDIITMPDINTKIFGVVEKILEDPSDPFKTILFKNPINMAEVKWVQVITIE